LFEVEVVVSIAAAAFLSASVGVDADGFDIAAAAFLSASVGVDADGFDIAAAAFLSASAEAAVDGASCPVRAVPGFCATGDWIKGNTVSATVAMDQKLLRGRLIVSSE
jgi:hypothetical protein